MPHFQVSRWPLAVALAVILACAPRGAAAQDQTTQFDSPAYVAAADPGAALEREGRVERSPLNMPLLSGDRLRTADGRMDVRFADGGHLFLDARTAVDVLSDDLIRLRDGRIRIVEMRTGQVSYRVDSTAGSVHILQPGEYRVALLHSEAPSTAGDTQIELAVTRGGAEIVTDAGSTPLRAGERAYASAGLLPSYTYSYNSAAADDFDRWTEAQQHGAVYAGASQSSEYLPAEISTYAPTFDQYGDWRYQQDYGYVWYPRVAADWRPYYYGRWASYPSYGWTWIASDPFGYPTHHYGRWGISAGVWFWIPSRHWGPAYVSWGYATDYVSWCPLGWNNRAVLGLDIYRVGPGYYSARNATAWTAVRRTDFGRGYAYQHAVRFDRSHTGARPQFTEGRTPALDRAVTRGSTPIRYAGTRATQIPGGNRGVPATALPSGRTDTPRYVNRGEQIVRSQTARPVPPRDTAVRRPAPATPSRAARTQYSWDNPTYRPPTPSAGISSISPASRQPAGSQPAYDHPVYRQPGAARPSYDRPAYDRPTYDRPAFDRPAVSAPSYGPASRQAAPATPERPGPRAAQPPRIETRPSGGGEHAVPRSSPTLQGAPGRIQGPSRPPTAPSAGVQQRHRGR